MMQKLLYFRFVYIAAVVFTLLNALFFILLGIARSIHGYMECMRIGFLTSEETHPGLYLLESLDSFMLSLVFMIFGLGIARIFLFDKSQVEGIPEWLNVHDFQGLKTLMWKTILFTLVVVSVTGLIKNPQYTWETLVFPIVILILSGALFLVNATRHESR